MGVDRRSSKKEIHNSYLKKCMKCHPDIFPNNSEKLKEFQDLQTAYERLMNWEKEKPKFDSQSFEKNREFKKGSSFQGDTQERPNLNWYSNNQHKTEWD